CDRCPPRAAALSRPPSASRNRGTPDQTRRSRFLGICASGAPVFGSAGCGLDRRPDPSLRSRSRGARLLPSGRVRAPRTGPDKLRPLFLRLNASLAAGLELAEVVESLLEAARVRLLRPREGLEPLRDLDETLLAREAGKPGVHLRVLVGLPFHR